MPRPRSRTTRSGRTPASTPCPSSPPPGTRSTAVIAAGPRSPSSWCATASCRPADVAPGADRYQRKLREIIQSIRLTEAYPGEDGKRLIMQSYLNNNYYGNRSYGVAAAAAQLLGQEPCGPHPRPVRHPGRNPQVPERLRPRPERGGGGLHRAGWQDDDLPGRAADNRGGSAPQRDPRVDEDPLPAVGDEVHQRGLRGGQGGARGARLPGLPGLAGAPLRVEGARRARPAAVRRKPVREDRHGWLHGDHVARLPDAAHRREVGLRGRHHPQQQQPEQAAQEPPDPPQRMGVDQGPGRPQHPQRRRGCRGLPDRRGPRLRGLGVVHGEGQQEDAAAVRRPGLRLAATRLVDQAVDLPDRHRRQDA